MQHAALEAFVDSLGETALDWRFKGFGTLARPLTLAEVQEVGVDLHELGTPMMTIDVSAVADNLLSMARWCTERGLQLAPHGKTTMAPVLWLGQLMTGSSGITVANAGQLRAARAFGVESLVLANELINPADIVWVATELAAHPGFRFLCWVDSVDDVARVEAAVAGRTGTAPLEVCVEVGAGGGRTGARGLDEVLQVARAVVASDAVRLAGLSCYEGAVPGAGTDEEGLAAVDDFLLLVRRCHEALSELYETPRVTVTAGGSAYFDRVAHHLGPLAGSTRVGGSGGQVVDVVLRSGAYVVHDDVHYRAVTPSTRGDGPPLRAAIHVWSTVISRPEADLVILDAGRRDVPFDLDLPVVLGASRAAGATRTGVEVGPAEVLRLNDQHAFVRIEPGSPLLVGDVVKLGLSHPCTAFDKWRAIPMIDSADVAAPRVSDVALTFF